jgi:DNA-binding transcriptional LysR family regulator
MLEEHSRVDRLDHGNLDLTLSYTDGPGERFATAPLLEDPFVMVMRRGHPASRRKLSAVAFAALSHLEISSNREDTGFIDHWFAERGFVRRIAQEFVRNHPLQIREPPYISPPVRTVMLWHRWLDPHPPSLVP